MSAVSYNTPNDYLRYTLKITILTWGDAASNWPRTQEPCDKTRVPESSSMAIGYLHQLHAEKWETAVAQVLRCCATNRKVAGSIPAGVSGFFIDIKSFWSHYGPGVDSSSNRNEYQEYFLGVKAAGA
jgi:hypothetical protein